MSTMKWLQVSVAVHNEVAEAVAEVFSRHAPRGVVIEAGPEGWNAGPVIVRAYLPADEQLSDRKRRIKRALGHLNQILPVPVPTFRAVAEEDWAEAWKAQLTVLHIGRQIVIQPSWLDYAPHQEDIVIRLDPGMAFGTGLHPTTQLCLAAVEDLVRPGMCLLDMGTGSGILAIAAAKLGAADVVAVDDDPVAVEAARANVMVNGVSDVVRVVQGSLADVPDGYDAIVINILSRVIIEMLQAGLAARIRSQGRLIAAGIISGQEPEVIAAAEQQGLGIVERRQKDDWVCLVARPRLGQG